MAQNPTYYTYYITDLSILPDFLPNITTPEGWMHPTPQWRVWNPNKHGLEGGAPNEIDGQDTTVSLPYDLARAH